MNELEQALAKKTLYSISIDNEKEVDYFYETYFRHKNFMKSIGEKPDVALEIIVNSEHTKYIRKKNESNNIRQM